MYILVARWYTIVLFEKVLSQWQLLYLFFWACLYFYVFGRCLSDLKHNQGKHLRVWPCLTSWASGTDFSLRGSVCFRLNVLCVVDTGAGVDAGLWIPWPVISWIMNGRHSYLYYYYIKLINWSPDSDAALHVTTTGKPLWCSPVGNIQTKDGT